MDEDRNLLSGCEATLVDAIRRGADLRVGTGFRHHEHIDPDSDCRDVIHEFIDFRVTYLLDDRWVAGICNLRMPVQLPDGFGPRSPCHFLCTTRMGNRLLRVLISTVPTSDGGRNGQTNFANMPRYLELDRWDDHTNAPSTNFIYKLDFYRFCVSDRWKEVLAHDADGTVQSGCLEDLVAAFNTGAELKVAIRGLCSDLPTADNSYQPEHEVFVHLGSCYYYIQNKQLIGATHPVIRVAPAIPLTYRTHGWDFGWLLPAY